MPQQLSGFPYWEVIFDEAGHFVDPPAIDTFLQEVGNQNLTDLFIFSHGWNNDQKMARELYKRFFAQLRAVLDQLGTPGVSRRRQATIGTVGVIWPSMRWIDEDPDPSAGSGAAGLSGANAVPTPSDAALVQALKAVYPAPQQQKALDELAQLLTDRPQSEEALARFQELMRPLTSTPDAVAAPEDSGERSLLGNAPKALFDRFADAAPRLPDEGGAAGFMDDIKRAWDRTWGGAKEALRQATYWEMKKRAGVVGQTGLGPLVGRVNHDLRIQLLGHSFGARLVSFALTGLPGGPTGAASPVKSLFLLEGAFSHFAFARSLPFAPLKKGALAGMTARVDGPISATYSTFDKAVTVYYPLASFASNDAASGLVDDFRFRWGGMGFDGAQGVNAAATPLLPVGQEYGFTLTPGLFVNLDGNRVIVNGTGVAGAHSDIVHPEIAWSALLNAGIAGAAPAADTAAAAPDSGGAADLGRGDHPGAAGTTPHVPSSVESPGPITERLLRVGVISEAFLQENAEDRQRVGVPKSEDEPGPVMVELNLLHATGLAGAKKSFRKLFAAVTGIAVTDDPDDPILTEITNTYFRCHLSMKQIRELVWQDQAGPKEGDVKNRSVYRIWPDFPVERFVDRSVSTVKGDAARRSYDASGAGITWAVIDSGIDASHPHFATHDTLKGDVAALHRDFTVQGKHLNDPAGITSSLTDVMGHGTHVAGIIAGSLLDPMKPPKEPSKFFVGQWADEQIKPIQERAGVDPNRLHGVAPLCKLISLRVLAPGQSYSSNVMRALQYIREELNGNGKLLRVHGVNLSLGYEFNAKWFACGGSPLCVEVDRLVRSGVVVVIAAGNTGYGSLKAQQRDTSTGLSLTINDPGNADLAITVGSTHRDSPHTFGISYFSSKGPTGDGRLKPDLVAPGERITSCAAGQNLDLLRSANLVPAETGLAAYLDDSGTSMAAPHVSGAVAAFLSIRREFIGQPEKVKQLFLKTATSLGRERYFEGYGLVDLMRAIQAV